MIKLFRTSSIYLPLSIMVKGKNSINDYELNNIIFFNEKGIITQTGMGRFEDEKEREFKGTCVRKLKIDFSMKDNFIVKADKDYFSEVKYDLYIYEGNVDLKYLGKEQKYFGDIYSHWKIDDYEFWRYEKSLCDRLNTLNDKAEDIIKNFLQNQFGYRKKGVDKEDLEIKLNMLKDLNLKILEEVENIKNYKI